MRDILADIFLFAGAAVSIAIGLTVAATLVVWIASVIGDASGITEAMKAAREERRAECTRQGGIILLDRNNDYNGCRIGGPK